MTNEHLDRLIDDAREGAKEASAAGRFRLMARLESCADELVKLRDGRTARDAEMRDERARTEAAESEVARLTARLATAKRLLRILEWSGLPTGGLRNCLFCSAKVVDSGEVHRAGCELAAFLAGPSRDSA